PFIQLLTGRADSIQDDGAIYEIEVEVGSTWTEPGFVALDNVDLIITDNVAIGGDAVDLESVGTYIVEYTVSDAAGNNAIVTREVVVRDGTAPTVGLIGPVPSVVPCNGNYFEFGANAFDAVDGSVDVIIGGDCVCPTQAGSYIVTYTAIDASGNEASESRLVIVQGDCDVACPTDDPDSPCYEIVGINDNYELYQAVDMYPNPTSRMLNVAIEGLNINNANVEVFNLVGKLIHTETMKATSLTIDMADNAAGIYIVKVSTTEGAIAKKVVLEK
ncbi:MAG: immunoglobulin-like domain-containing protein, partial [Chitinophagales bacterium]